MAEDDIDISKVINEANKVYAPKRVPDYVPIREPQETKKDEDESSQEQKWNKTIVGFFASLPYGQDPLSSEVLNRLQTEIGSVVPDTTKVLDLRMPSDEKKMKLVDPELHAEMRKIPSHARGVYTQLIHAVAKGTPRKLPEHIEPGSRESIIYRSDVTLGEVRENGVRYYASHRTVGGKSLNLLAAFMKEKPETQG